LAHTIPIKKAKVPVMAMISMYGQKNGKTLTTKYIIVCVHKSSIAERRSIGKRKSMSVAKNYNFEVYKLYAMGISVIFKIFQKQEFQVRKIFSKGVYISVNN
jgi:hypothetical protein